MTDDPTIDDIYFHGGQERLEAKLRLFVLRRHIKEAEAGVLDHVIHELGMMALGKKADGSPLEIEPRTRQQAMATYLRNVEKAARLHAPHVTIDRVGADQSTHVNLAVFTPELIDRLKGQPELRQKIIEANDALMGADAPALPEPEPHPHEGNGKEDT